MALSQFTANAVLTAANLNVLVDHLQGAAGSTDAWFFRLSAGNNYLIRLPEAAGVNEVQIQDSAGVSVASIDSDGNVSFSGTLAVTGAVTLTVALGVAQGGTGLATFTAAGALPYSTAATTLAALAAGTARQGLIMNAAATAPSWAASLQSLMTTTGDIVYASAANTPARLAVGTALQVLIGGATIPAYLVAGTGSQQLRTNAGATALEWFTPAAAGVTRAGGQTTESTMASTTAADLIVVSGLSIAAGTLVHVFGHARKSAGAAVRGALGIAVNATVVHEADAAATDGLWISGAVDQAEDGIFHAWFYVGEANYRASYDWTFISRVTATGAQAIGGAPGRGVTLTAVLPSATITSITIRADSGSALVTVGCDDLNISTFAVV